MLAISERITRPAIIYWSVWNSFLNNLEAIIPVMRARTKPVEMATLNNALSPIHFWKRIIRTIQKRKKPGAEKKSDSIKIENIKMDHSLKWSLAKHR